MSLHYEGGYTAPYSQIDHNHAFESAKAEAAEATMLTAMLRAANEAGWVLICPVTKQPAARLPQAYWGGQIVNKGGKIIQYALNEAGHEVAGFGGESLSNEWLPQGALNKAERWELRDYFRREEYLAELEAEKVAKEAAAAARAAKEKNLEDEHFRNSGNPWAALSVLKKKT